MEDNVDYKELYLKMMRASEEAIRILIQAQQDCEELYLQGTDHTSSSKQVQKLVLIPDENN